MFGLIWANEALDQLADVYVTATLPDRERITAGVDALNNRLRETPDEEGESRAGSYRLTFVPLLAVLFDISVAESVVYVVALQRYGR